MFSYDVYQQHLMLLNFFFVTGFNTLYADKRLRP